MPIYKGSTNYTKVAKGSSDMSKVYIGSTLKFDKDKYRAINLGSGQSWNIKTMYPNLYSSLTANNFFILSHNNCSCTDSGSMDPYNRFLNSWFKLYKSYNASTGVLNMYYQGRGGRNGNVSKVNVTAVLVSDTSLLTQITATSGTTDFNVKSYSGYSSFTTNNFLIRDISEFQGPNFARDSGYAESTTYSNFNKSYSNGILTCYERVYDSEGELGNFESTGHMTMFLYRNGVY